MGDIADYYRDQELEMEFNPPKSWTDDGKYTFWRTRDGSKIHLKDMTTSHIKNSIAMIKRNHGWREDWLEPLNKELEYR